MSSPSRSQIKYIYKILPFNPPPPIPLPESLPVSALDMKDGYIHASTSKQLLSTLNKFFAGKERVWILRLGYEGMKGKGVVKWETPQGAIGTEGQAGYFPHLYNGLKLGKEEVESVGEWKRGAGDWSAEGWPFEEDIPA